jgi:hypothetical protein
LGLPGGALLPRRPDIPPARHSFERRRKRRRGPRLPTAWNCGSTQEKTCPCRPGPLTRRCDRLRTSIISPPPGIFPGKFTWTYLDIPGLSATQPDWCPKGGTGFQPVISSVPSAPYLFISKVGFGWISLDSPGLRNCQGSTPACPPSCPP